MVPNVGESYERFEAAIRLYLSGRAQRIVFTGANLPWDGRPENEGQVCRRLAVERGVPPAAIWVTRNVINTREEAMAVKELVKELELNSLAVVTTGWHMPRALRCMESVGVKCIPFPVDIRVYKDRKISILDFLPQGEAAKDTEIVVREIYGLAMEISLSAWRRIFNK